MALLPTARPRARAVLAACAAISLAGFGAGCGESGGNPDADPAAVVPGNAPVYLEAVVKPEGDQRAEVEAVLKKVMRTNDPGAKLKQAFDDAAKDDGVTYDKDIKPWLGQRVGAFFTSFGRNGNDAQGAAVIATEDQDKALEALRKGEKGLRDKTYKDTKYQVSSNNQTALAGVGDYVVIGTENGVKAVIDTEGDSARSLAKNDTYNKTRDEAGEEGIGFVYADPSALINAVASSGGVNSAQLAPLRQILAGQGTKAVGATINAASDGFSIATATLGARASKTASGNAAAALKSVPGDSWLALGIGNIGGKLNDALRQFAQIGGLAGTNVDQILAQLKQQSGLDVRKDLLDWMGDGALFVRGESLGDIGGGLVVKSKDPQATQRGIARVARLLRRQGQTVTRVTGVSGVDVGISLKAQQGIDVFLVSAGDKFVAAVGRTALEGALKPSSTLGSDAEFKAASGKLGGLAPALYLELQPILRLAESTGATDDPDYQKAKPYLEAFTWLIAGSKRDGDVARGKVFLGVK